MRLHVAENSEKTTHVAGGTHVTGDFRDDQCTSWRLPQETSATAKRAVETFKVRQRMSQETYDANLMSWGLTKEGTNVRRLPFQPQGCGNF